MTIRVATEADARPVRAPGRHHGVHLMSAVEHGHPVRWADRRRRPAPGREGRRHHRRRVGNGQGISQGLHP